MIVERELIIEPLCVLGLCVMVLGVERIFAEILVSRWVYVSADVQSCVSYVPLRRIPTLVAMHSPACSGYPIVEVHVSIE